MDYSIKSIELYIFVVRNPYTLQECAEPILKYNLEAEDGTQTVAIVDDLLQVVDQIQHRMLLEYKVFEHGVVIPVPRPDDLVGETRQLPVFCMYYDDCQTEFVEGWDPLAGIHKALKFDYYLNTFSHTSTEITF